MARRTLAEGIVAICEAKHGGEGYDSDVQDRVEHNDAFDFIAANSSLNDVVQQVDELNDEDQDCASVKLFRYAQKWLPERVCREVHNLDQGRVVVVLPVDGAFFSVSSICLRFFDAQRLFRFGKRLLCELVNSVLLKVNHDDKEEYKFKL